MTQTLLTLNTNTLSRAADEILKSPKRLGKNSLLNIFAAAIAGPGKDWAFIKNNPNGHYIQPGVSTETAPTKQETSPASIDEETKVWMLSIDTDHDYRGRGKLFKSANAAIAHLEKHIHMWADSSEQAQDALAQIRKSNSYYDNGAKLHEDPLNIEIEWEYIEQDEPDAEPQVSAGTPTSETQQEDPAPVCTTVFHPDITSSDPGYQDQGIQEQGMFFKSRRAFLEWANKHNLNNVKQPGWRDDLVYVSDLDITVDFTPQAWVNDYALNVDSEGETTWSIRPHEIDPNQGDLDYLKYSKNAPKWVREWSGPFEITMLL